MILEAMKMENEILAPADGVVKAIHVSSNESVESNPTTLNDLGGDGLWKSFNS